MFFFLSNQSSIWCFLKSLKTTTAVSFCFWSPCRRVTTTSFLKNNLMIAPRSCFLDTLYTQQANFNSAIPPIVQTALSAGSVLIRLCRSNSHHNHVTTAGWIYQFAFNSCWSLPPPTSNSCFHLKHNRFSSRNSYVLWKNKQPTHLKTKTNWADSLLSVQFSCLWQIHMKQTFPCWLHT